MLEAITELDFTILNFFQAHFRCAFLDTICGLFNSTVVIIVICALICGILLIFKKTRRCGMVALIALGAVLLIGGLGIKNIVCRVRPCYVRPIANMAVMPLRSYSFPSGHSSTSFAIATAVFIRFRGWGILALVLALFVGLSRIYLYVHYPSDVLAGMVLGVVTAVAVWLIAQKIKPSRRLRKH